MVWPPRGSHRVGATRLESGPPRGGDSSWAVRRRTPARGLRRAERSSIAFRSCSRGSACDRSGEGEGGSRASAAPRLAGSPGRGNSEKAGAPIGARAPGPIVEGEESDRGPLRKGSMRSFSVNRAAWHAVTSPESPGGEGFAKGRHRWVRSPRARPPTAREARLQGRFAYRRDVPPGRIRLFGQPSRRTGESPRTRCTAHPVGYTSSFVICRFRRTRHRARRFCERWARQRPRSQGGCAPAAPAPRRSRCEGRSESE